MFLKKIKNDKGRIFLQIVNGFRNERGTTSHEVVESLGYLDELELTIEDPITFYKEKAKQMTLDAKHEKTVIVNPKTELQKGINSLRNAGYLALKPILTKLKLDVVTIALNQKHQCETNLYDILSFLVYSQIIHPSSKQSSYHKKDMFFENYQFSEDQLYRSLSYLGNSYETIKDYLYHTTHEAYGLDINTTYYDGTNFYFEIDYETEFQKKGPSKEGRKSPLVSLGILLDNNQIPIDLNIYPGNESEKPHFGKTIDEMKAKKKITGRTIYVADKGLNTGTNIFNALKNKDGYIYSQTVRGANQSLKSYIKNDYGFEDIYDEYGQLEYRIKGFIDPEALIRFEHEGKKYQHKVKQLQVVTWSKKYADKTRYEREKMISKARHLIKSPYSYTKDKLGSAASYLKEIKFDKNGEVMIDSSILILDEAKIKKESELDGYYLIVTSELTMKPKDVLSAYRKHVYIEDIFKVAKLFLKIRPVHLQLKERIEAHVLTCYIALIVLRILETKVLKKKYSFHAIIDGIRSYQCAQIKPNTYFFFKYNELMNELASLSGANAKLETQTLSQIKKLFKNY